MKLALGFAFAVIPSLLSLQLVSAQIPDEGKRKLDTNASEEVFSGDDEYPIFNQTLEDSRQDEDENFFSINQNSFNSTRELLETPDNTNKTLIQKYNTSSPVAPPVINDTNYADTLQPETNSTGPQPGSWPFNKTVTDTFGDTRNSTTTGGKGNMTTTLMPPVPKTTKDPFEGKPNGTTPRMTTKSATTNMTTGKLPGTVGPGSTTVQSTKSNRTGGSFDARGGSDRGFSSDVQQNTNNHAWGAIVGICVVVGITALVVYVIVKWKDHRDFSHRKLVEDPVLRLDNSEPLDLKFDGSAYYNPGLQGDNIQMTNFPHGHFK